jgi:hypothetical protein
MHLDTAHRQHHRLRASPSNFDTAALARLHLTLPSSRRLLRPRMRHGTQQQCGKLPRYAHASPVHSCLQVVGKLCAVLQLEHEKLITCPVWRYLQEAGFGNAALQLSRCWLRDPETLPFAKNISPHTLVRLLQDGMEFDKLRAEATNVCDPGALRDDSADCGRPTPSTTLVATTADPTLRATAPS